MKNNQRIFQICKNLTYNIFVYYYVFYLILVIMVLFLIKKRKKDTKFLDLILMF